MKETKVKISAYKSEIFRLLREVWKSKNVETYCKIYTMLKYIPKN